MPSGVYKRIKGNRKGETRLKYPIQWFHKKHEGLTIAGSVKNRLPPLEILNWLFRYDSDTGKIYRKQFVSKSLIGTEKEIKSRDNRYLVLTIPDSNSIFKVFQAHQIMYFMYHGVEPMQIVDHIDGDIGNNAINNLRLVTESYNNRNRKRRTDNTSGATGVYWSNKEKKWVVTIRNTERKQMLLGRFVDKEEAIKVAKDFYDNPDNGYTERHGL